MKGVVFNLLEDCVRKAHGDDVWDELLERAGLEGAYTSLATYPDCQLGAIVGAASETLGIPADDVVHWFAVQAAGIFAERFPTFFTPHTTTRSFLGALNDIIHPEVRKLYPQAETPRFELETHADGRLVMHYFSKRQLCRFAAGLVVGSAPRFGERATIEHGACTRSGADHCILLIDLKRADG